MSFGDVGKAIVVIIMIIQIAGSSGSFPIELLPTFFQKVYIFFPFPYAINAMRECIAGMDALKLDSGALVNYLSSPVNLETVQLFAIKDYGSAASPFYTILSLWVGGLFNVVIIKTEVKPYYDLPKLTKWEGFWGRYFIVFAIGQMTALITGLGNLFYLGVQCYHPFLYMLALFVTDFAITFLNYALVYAFDVAGLAISVILMCIQVGGSGGTYPVEVLPKIFQDLYRYMCIREASVRAFIIRATISWRSPMIFPRMEKTLPMISIILSPCTS